MIFETPPELAQYAAEYAPRQMSSLLDPAVGKGRLLVPFIERAGLRKIVAVDKKACDSSIKKVISHGNNVRFIQDDFLKIWSGLGKFDCVVMNPPFAARQSEWVRIPIGRSGAIFSMPVEVAFVFRAIELLNPLGRLLAILPASFVSSRRLDWARSSLFAFGSLITVHELPRGTFKNTEVAVYVLVFERGTKREDLTLSNSSMRSPESLCLNKYELRPEWRFDFNYHKARRALNILRARTEDLGWQRLQSIALISRGEVESPIQTGAAIHTTDYAGALWTAKNVRKPRKGANVTSSEDILLSRVGRRCNSTFGVVAQSGIPYSDCVYVIRPLVRTNRDALLYALRVVFGEDQRAALIAQGTGAQYIRKGQLQRIQIPTRLSERQADLFVRYRRALRHRNAKELHAIERAARERLAWELAES